ncbi:MAG TPA: DUF302 domain-containing protein [Campylobacteraceae bacterium]|nr:DUF302 domain-containing protein [Campylobacteraceae bacterium]
MQKRVLTGGFALGFIAALFLIPLMFKTASKNMLFNEVASPYDFDKTVSLIADRIDHQPGWHVTQIIDQQQEILSHGGNDVGKVKIIKFCNAKLSGKMLAEDARKYMAVKMPLSIAVYEKSNGKVAIGLMNGYLMARMFSGSDEGEIMEKVVKDMESIMDFVHFRFTIF